MLQPKRVRYRKVQKGTNRGKAHNGALVHFGEYGLQSLENGRITNHQIESARRAMTRYIKKDNQVWIRIFPDKSVTKKPAETRMGNGKGSPEYWVALVKSGRVMFEISGVSLDIAKEAMRLAMYKLPVKCKFVTKADQDEQPDTQECVGSCSCNCTDGKEAS